MWRVLLVAALLFIPAHAEDAPPPCVIPKAPPCLTIQQLREKLSQGHCTFEVGSCISLQWDDYGKSVVRTADVLVKPACADPKSAARLEAKGRAYLEGLQSIPIDITLITLDCADKGTVDVRITETSPWP
jgi:hypothetical protein